MFSYKFYPSLENFTPSQMVWLVTFCKSAGGRQVSGGRWQAGNRQVAGGRWEAGGQEQEWSYLAPPPPPAPPAPPSPPPPPPPAAPSAVVNPPPLFPCCQETTEGWSVEARTNAAVSKWLQLALLLDVTTAIKKWLQQRLLLEVTTAITQFTLDSHTVDIWLSNWNFRNKDGIVVGWTWPQAIDMSKLNSG